jgi:MoaA/NifB/PqqE/SkfB family radical SAM enzyme
MIKIEDIREINIELSSRCNARCPLCIRNFHGFPHNTGYEETDLSLARLKEIVPESVVTQLDHVMVNGDYGDMLMNPETPDILAWFRQHGRKETTDGHNIQRGLIIDVFTNGGARGREFWEALGKLDLDVNFCIDGLEDTHHLYRQNTLYETVIRNAGYYMAAGGRAHWCMTEFDHNRHQIDQARERSTKLGFHRFFTRYTGRDAGPVYDQQGKKVFVLKQETANGYQLPDQITTEWVNQQDRNPKVIPHKKITCEALTVWPVSVYIAADGTLDPCCLIGNYTKPNNNWDQNDLSLLRRENIDTLEKNVAWFNRVIETFGTDGQLNVCNIYCGRD